MPPSRLARSASSSSLVVTQARLEAAHDCSSTGRQRRSRQPMAEPWSPSRRRWFASGACSGGTPSFRRRSTQSTAGPLRARGRSLWLSRSTLDGAPCGSVDSHPLWRNLPSPLYPFLAQPVGLDLAETPKASKPTRRVGYRPVARSNGARHQKKVTQENRTLVCIDEAAFYLLPSVGYTWAPQGQPPILLGSL